MKKKILLIIIMILFGMSSVKSLTYGGCDYSTVSKFKSLVSNINIYYDYHISGNQAYFDITLTNITPNMYFLDMEKNITYTYNDTNNGEITIKGYSNQSGSYKFYLQECNNVLLGTKYYKFPTYNIYYNDPLCSDIPNYSLCRKWVDINYSYDEFERRVEEYKSRVEEEDLKPTNIEYHKSILEIIADIYVNYYYYFFIAIILVCGSIIFINRRKNKFKL